MHGFVVQARTLYVFLGKAGTMYDCVGQARAMYEFVGRAQTMYGFVGQAGTTYGYVGQAESLFGFVGQAATLYRFVCHAVTMYGFVDQIRTMNIFVDQAWIPYGFVGQAGTIYDCVGQARAIHAFMGQTWKVYSFEGQTGTMYEFLGQAPTMYVFVGQTHTLDQMTGDVGKVSSIQKRMKYSIRRILKDGIACNPKEPTNWQFVGAGGKVSSIQKRMKYSIQRILKDGIAGNPKETTFRQFVGADGKVSSIQDYLKYSIQRMLKNGIAANPKEPTFRQFKYIDGLGSSEPGPSLPEELVSRWGCKSGSLTTSAHFGGANDATTFFREKFTGGKWCPLLNPRAQNRQLVVCPIRRDLPPYTPSEHLLTLAGPIQESDQDGAGPFRSLADARPTRRRREIDIRVLFNQFQPSRPGIPSPPSSARLAAVTGSREPVDGTPSPPSSARLVAVTGSREPVGPVGGTSPGDAADIARMKEENEEMRRQQECVVCLIKARNILFSPCHHVICCSDCAQRLDEARDVPNCPMCRAPIENMMHIFRA